jgi:hypothetical protein
METRNWEQILDGLRVPFSVETVAWKPQTISRERKRCLAVPYVDTQPYQERLDQICPEWQDDYAIWFSDPQEALGRSGEKRVISGKVFVKCRLTIADRTRSDVGECELTDENALTSAKAQAFKRACAAFGLGRYLYDLPKSWVDFDPERGIPEPELKRLEGLLRRYAGSTPVRHEVSRPLPEAAGRSSGGNAASVEHEVRLDSMPQPAEALGQSMVAGSRTNGYAARSAANTNGHAPQASAADGRPVGTGRADSVPPAAGAQLRRPAGESPAGERPAGASKAQAGDQAAVPEQPAQEVAGRPHAEQGSAAPATSDSPEVAGGRQPATSPATPADKGHVEAPKSLARKKAPETAAAGAPANRAASQRPTGAPAAAQPADSALPSAGDTEAHSPAGGEGEGPVLCPIHNVPLQLLVTREGKALLLHKVESGDAGSAGYCNGQEVRQVARG